MSQFAPKRIFSSERFSSSDTETYLPNGQSCVIVNGNLPATPPNTPSEDGVEHPDSPGFHRTKSYDEVLFDIRRVPPEKIAAQLTLIDLPLFQAIRMEEFCNCNWTKKNKVQLAPNIVAFTRKFNHTSFWVVREILNEANLRIRAEILTQFIKIAKKLQDQNNLHSLKAVVSALQSVPIYRLSQTWKLVPRKDRTTFERLEEFLSDDENRKNLREHMNAAKLPCIPHLGMYLTDLTFLQTLNSKGASRQTQAQIDVHMNMIGYCQNSTYEDLTAEPHIQKYLNHVRYIDELQKLFEDDNYQLSLKREPEAVQLRGGKGIVPSSGSQLRSSKSHEDLLTPFTTSSMDSLATVGSHSSSKTWTPQPQHRPRYGLHSGSSHRQPGEEIRFEIAGTPSNSDHKKTSIFPSRFRGSFSGSLPTREPFFERRRVSESDDNPLKLLELPPPPPELNRKMQNSSPSLKWKRERGHKKSHSLGTNAFGMLSITKTSPVPSRNTSPELSHQLTSRNLIDDSVLDETGTSYGTNTPTGSVGNLSSSSSSLGSGEGEEGEVLCKRLEDVDELSVDQLEMVLKEGYLRRKVLKRAGRSLSLRRTSKCWVQLIPTSLLLYPSKPKTSKKTSKPQKVKGIMLKSCRIQYRDLMVRISDKQFVIIDERGTHTKFTVKSSAVAQEWVERIRTAISEEQEREKREAEKSLIKL